MKGFTKILAFLLLFCTSGALAQQEAQFSQYMFNNLFLNPAYAGLQGQSNFMLIHRSQWAGYNGSFDDGGAPVTQVLSFTSPLYFINSGIGFHAVNDRLGPVSNVEAHVSYAYHLAVNEGKGKLSIGFRGGIYSQTIDFDLYRAENKDLDDLLRNAQGKESQIRPDIGFGLFYTSTKFYAGISGNRLLQTEFNFGLGNIQNPLSRNMYLTAGYFYELNPTWTISPSVLLKTDFITYSFDISAIATYQERFWGGLTFRQADAAGLLLGINTLQDKEGFNRLKVGYSFDYTIVGQQGKSPTSHEIFLSYALPAASPASRPPQKTPRYHY
jgi:type IX secretion system PorP/SprF family membrane protein